MRFMLEAVLDFIDKTGGIGRQDTLLTCLQYAVCACLCTIVEKEQNLLRPPLNLRARPFYPQNAEFQKDHIMKDQIL